MSLVLVGLLVNAAETRECRHIDKEAHDQDRRLPMHCHQDAITENRRRDRVRKNR